MAIKRANKTKQINYSNKISSYFFLFVVVVVDVYLLLSHLSKERIKAHEEA
jgi:hypothetical protein